MLLRQRARITMMYTQNNGNRSDKMDFFYGASPFFSGIMFRDGVKDAVRHHAFDGLVSADAAADVGA